MAALLVLGPLAGCSSDLPASRGVAGRVVVDGSSTVTPLLQAVADELVAQVEPGVVVDLSTSGTAGGVARLCAGEADLAMASRSMTEEEAGACEAGGVDVVTLPLGLDAVTVVVPARNDHVDCLTTAELAAVLGGLGGPGGGAPVTWADVRDGWPATTLVPFAPGPASGTSSVVVDEILDGGRLREGVRTSEDDRAIVQGVAASPGGVGVVPLGAARAGEDLVRTVALDAGDGCVEPDDGTVTDGSYPLGRPLQVYVSRSSHASDGAVAALVRHLLARGAELAGPAGVVPPTPQQQEAAARALEELGPGPG